MYVTYRFPGIQGYFTREMNNLAPKPFPSIPQMQLAPSRPPSGDLQHPSSKHGDTSAVAINSSMSLPCRFSFGSFPSSHPAQRPGIHTFEEKKEKKKNATATQPWPRFPRPYMRLLCLSFASAWLSWLCGWCGVSHVIVSSNLTGGNTGYSRTRGR